MKWFPETLRECIFPIVTILYISYSVVTIFKQDQFIRCQGKIIDYQRSLLEDYRVQFDIVWDEKNQKFRMVEERQ